ncbi:hypothetical protein Tco_1228530 [Tanacetum coccineum]
MSSIGELTFFIGLQVQQKEDGIFISQDKYVDDILKKFSYIDVKSASTLVDLEKPLVKDGDANDVDVHLYRSMIRDSPFELVSYTDSDYARATQDRKSTTGGCQFLGNRLISCQCKKQTVVATSTTEAEYVAAASCYLLTKGFDVGRFQYLVSTDETVHKEMGDIMERAVTTASSLEAKQDSEFCDKHKMVAYLEKSEGSEEFHQIIDFLSASHIKIPSLPTAEIFKQLALIGVITPLFDTMLVQHQGEEPSTSPSRITFSLSLSTQTHPSTSHPPVTKEATLMPHESPLQSVHSLGRDEGSSSLNDLMVLYTSLTKKVESLESELKQTKQTFNAALIKLIKRVKKLEQTIKTSQARRRTKIVISDDEDAEEDSSKQGRKISKIDKDPTISLVQEEEWYGLGGCRDINGEKNSKSLEPLKKIKKRVQVQISIDEELAKKVFEEEQARFNVEQEAKFKAEQEKKGIDFETNLKLQKASWMKEKEVVSAHDIVGECRSYPAVVLRYHAIQNRSFSKDGSFNHSDYMIVYVAPMKALVAEDVGNLSNRLKDYGVSVMELSGDQSLTLTTFHSTESNSNEEANVTGSMVKSSKEMRLKKFDFVTEDGRHIHLTEEQIDNQKNLEEAKAEAAK